MTRALRRALSAFLVLVMIAGMIPVARVLADVEVRGVQIVNARADDERDRLAARALALVLDWWRTDPIPGVRVPVDELTFSVYDSAEPWTLGGGCTGYERGDALPLNAVVCGDRVFWDRQYIAMLGGLPEVIALFAHEIGHVAMRFDTFPWDADDEMSREQYADCLSGAAVFALVPSWEDRWKVAQSVRASGDDFGDVDVERHILLDLHAAYSGDRHGVAIERVKAHTAAWFEDSAQTCRWRATSPYRELYERGFEVVEVAL